MACDFCRRKTLREPDVYLFYDTDEGLNDFYLTLSGSQLRLLTCVDYWV